ncbi:MAG: very short patch repair endonuclease [Chthoniobacteraceae bacterium]
MPDVFTKAKRSVVMAAIRSWGNKDTELRMVALFRLSGIKGWRRHLRLRIAETGPRKKETTVRLRPVSVDFVFPKPRVAVFVDGCFWHGCPKHATKPKQNATFWQTKLTRNRERDLEVTKALRKAGWRVVRVWECDLAKEKTWPRVTKRIQYALTRALA